MSHMPTLCVVFYTIEDKSTGSLSEYLVTIDPVIGSVIGSSYWFKNDKSVNNLIRMRFTFE